MPGLRRTAIVLLSALATLLPIIWLPGVANA